MHNHLTGSRLLAGVFAGALALTVQHARAQDLTFAYIAGSMIWPYDAATAAGFEAEAKSVGAKTIIVDPHGQVERQGNAIDDLLAQKVSGIGFQPVDSVASEALVDRISQKGIPVVAVAVQVGDGRKRSLKDVYPGLTALVTPDDVFAGEQAGKLAATLLPKDRKAKIAVVEGAPGFALVKQRTDGFEKALNDAGVKYGIVGTQPTDFTPEQGEAVCQNFLTATPDLDMIFSQADDMAIGCARAIASQGSHAKLVATNGGSKLGNAAIEAGELDGSVCVKPQLLGRLMFKALYEAATKPETKKGQLITVDLPIVTKRTLAECPAEW